MGHFEELHHLVSQILRSQLSRDQRRAVIKLHVVVSHVKPVWLSSARPILDELAMSRAETSLFLGVHDTVQLKQIDLSF
jgi:hypothetical protein